MESSGAPTTRDVDMVRNAARRLAFAASMVQQNAEQIATAGRIVGEALLAGKKVLACGNGGSAACSQHFAAEFTGKLSLDRPALPAIALTVDTSALTAIANDFTYDYVFARQVDAHGVAGDVLVGMTTSGSSGNVREAVRAAEARGVTTIVLTGPDNAIGGDVPIRVAVNETARIQEAHDLILHEIAQVAERVVFADLGNDASADGFPFVLSGEDLTAFREWIDFTGQSLVTTNGVFDLLHDGHRGSLLTARGHGDRLVVLVNSDESVQRLKGPDRPVEAIDVRALHLAHVPAVDHVVVMDGDEPSGLLGQLRPHVHCKGEDYRDREMPEREVVEANGGTIALLPLLDGHSTSLIIDKIAER